MDRKDLLLLLLLLILLLLFCLLTLFSLSMSLFLFFFGLHYAKFNTKDAYENKKQTGQFEQETTNTNKHI